MTELHQTVVFEDMPRLVSMVLRHYTERCILRLMSKLKTFIKNMTAAERDAFAGRCGTTLRHLTNVAYGYKPCGESLAINVDRESNGAVPCESLRPDVDFGYLRSTPKRTDVQPGAN